jgi:hypothetical protein
MRCLIEVYTANRYNSEDDKEPLLHYIVEEEQARADIEFNKVMWPRDKGYELKIYTLAPWEEELI